MSPEKLPKNIYSFSVKYMRFIYVHFSIAFFIGALTNVPYCDVMQFRLQKGQYLLNMDIFILYF